RERRADVQAEFVPLPERHHGADHEHAAGALVEMRSGPDLTPGVARDQVLEIDIERIPGSDRLVDPGIAEHLAALDHAAVAALLVVHYNLRHSGQQDQTSDAHCASGISSFRVRLFEAPRKDNETSVASGNRPPRR